MNNLRLFPRYVNSFQVEDIQPIEEVQYNPQTYILKSTTYSDRLVLTELIRIARIKQDIYVSHETIAKNINRCRKTVQRAIKKLRNLGLVNYLFRHNKSSLYRPSSFLLLEWVRNSLKSIIPTLSWISVSFLTAGQFAVPLIQTEMSHDIKQNSYLSLLSVSKSITKVNYDKNKGAKVAKPERVMNPRIEKLRELLNLEFYEANGLSKYPDWILDKALSRIEKIKSMQRKSEYLFALCESELKPKPKVEAAYNHLRKSYNTSDNFTQPKPPSHKVYTSKPIVLEKVSDEKFENKKEILDNLHRKAIFLGQTFFADTIKIIENLKNATRE